MGSVIVEEVQECLAALYKTIEGREVGSYQIPELMGLLSWTPFSKLISLILDELHKLDPECQSLQLVGEFEKDETALRQFVTQREYERLSGADGVDFQLSSFRCSLLLALTGDLLAARIESKKCLRTDLQISSPGKELPEIVEDLNHRTLSLATAVGVEGTAGNFSVAEVLQNVDRKVRSNIKDIAKQPKNHLLLSQWKPSVEGLQLCNRLAAGLNFEYSVRKRLFIKRAHVTVQGLLWSPKAKHHYNDLITIIEDHSVKMKKLLDFGVSVWDALAATREITDTTKISSEMAKSAVTSVLIGSVPNRGGVPEGYTAFDIQADVKKANVDLQKKDQREAANKARSAADQQYLPGPRQPGNPWSRPKTPVDGFSGRLSGTGYDSGGGRFSPKRHESQYGGPGGSYDQQRPYGTAELHQRSDTYGGYHPRNSHTDSHTADYYYSDHISEGKKPGGRFPGTQSARGRGRGGNWGGGNAPPSCGWRGYGR